MKRASLHRRVRLFILLPLVFGSVITALAALLPIYMQYSTWIDNITADIVTNQGKVLIETSHQVSQVASSFLQVPVNYIIVMGTLMNDYYAGTLLMNVNYLKQPTLQQANYVSAVVLGNMNQTKKNYEVSMWYVSPNITQPQDLDQISTQHLTDCAAFDSFVRPIILSSNVHRTLDVIYGFSSDGFWYSDPSSSYPEIFAKYNGGPNCSYNLYRKPQFDPRCRPWFRVGLEAQERYLPLLTYPFMLLWDNEIRQTIVYGVWNNEELELVLTVDFSVAQLEVYTKHASLSEYAYSFALNEDGSIFSHPDFNRSLPNVQSIYDLEFGGNTSSDARFFQTNIMPSFQQGQKALLRYYKNGETMLIAIHPVYSFVSMGKLQETLLSVAVVMPEHELWVQADALKSAADDVLIVEIIVLLGAIMVMVVLGCM